MNELSARPGCPSDRWFGEYDLTDRPIVHWEIGPLRLWLAWRKLEWWVGWRTGSDVTNDSLVVADDFELGGLPDEAEKVRFAVQGTSGKLRLAPRTADRPVVSRPRVPFQVLAGEDVRVYVSTPVWVELRIAPEDRLLMELPALRPHDTWMGPDTRSGEVAYASFTKARVELRNMPPHPALAVTEVTIENRGRDMLLIERLSIPAPELSLYADEHNCLWTESLTVRRDPGGKLADVRLAEGPPSAHTENAKRVAEPRVRRGSVLRRALAGLLG